MPGTVGRRPPLADRNRKQRHQSVTADYDATPWPAVSRVSTLPDSESPLFPRDSAKLNRIKNISLQLVADR